MTTGSGFWKVDSGLAAPAKQSLNGTGILSLVQHRIHKDKFPFDSVIDTEWEGPRDHPVKAKNLTVITVADQQLVNARTDRNHEVVADSSFLALVEKKAVPEVFLGTIEDSDSHDARLLSSFFTSLQSS